MPHFMTQMIAERKMQIREHGRQKGRPEGEWQGLVKAALALARKRYGVGWRKLKKLETLLQAAEPEEMDDWYGRLVTAPSFEEAMNGSLGNGVPAQAVPEQSTASAGEGKGNPRYRALTSGDKQWAAQRDGGTGKSSGEEDESMSIGSIRSVEELVDQLFSYDKYRIHEKAWRKGRKEGLQVGQLKGLLTVALKKFEKAPKRLEALLLEAQPNEMDDWMGRLVSASSVAEAMKGKRRRSSRPSASAASAPSGRSGGRAKQRKGCGRTAWTSGTGRGTARRDGGTNDANGEEYGTASDLSNQRKADRMDRICEDSLKKEGIEEGRTTGWASGWLAGWEKAEEKHRVTGIMDIARVRFGVSPKGLEDLLRAAKPEELTSWTIRLATASGIEEAMNVNRSWDNGATA